MAIFSENLENLRELYTNQLQHLLSAETQLTEAQPKMAEAATDPRLKQAIQTHLQETRQHVSKLESLLEKTNKSPDSKESDAMSALISEGEEIIKDVNDDAVRDAGLILAAQRVEHYEIASYGAMRRFAELLGDESAAQTLQQIEKEEGNADQLLSEISKSANEKANQAA